MLLVAEDGLRLHADLVVRLLPLYWIWCLASNHIQLYGWVFEYDDRGGAVHTVFDHSSRNIATEQCRCIVYVRARQALIPGIVGQFTNVVASMVVAWLLPKVGGWAGLAGGMLLGTVECFVRSFGGKVGIYLM